VAYSGKEDPAIPNGIPREVPSRLEAQDHLKGPLLCGRARIPARRHYTPRQFFKLSIFHAPLHLPVVPSIVLPWVLKHNCTNPGTPSPHRPCGQKWDTKPARPCGQKWDTKPARPCGQKWDTKPARPCGHNGTPCPRQECQKRDTKPEPGPRNGTGPSVGPLRPKGWRHSIWDWQPH
jgi:hypothetical protein